MYIHIHIFNALYIQCFNSVTFQKDLFDSKIETQLLLLLRVRFLEVLL